MSTKHTYDHKYCTLNRTRAAVPYVTHKHAIYIIPLNHMHAHKHGHTQSPVLPYMPDDK